MRVGFFVLLWIIFFQSLNAQSNEGKEFWFTFMEHVDSKQNTMVVMITSRYATSGTVKMDGINWRSGFNVAANDVTIIRLPVDAENVGSESVQKLGVKVESDLPISVYIHQYSNLRSDASLVLPIEALGTEYFTLNYRGFNNMGRYYPSECVVVGTEDGTVVEIIPSANTLQGKRAGQPISVTLNQGETYLLQAELTADLTGTYIKSDKKVAVLSGNAWTEIPQGCPNWDNLLEMMPPLNTWGKKYITTPTKLRYEVIRIIASQDNTLLQIDGSQSSQVTINRGQSYEFNASEAYYIHADKPILVGKFFPGRSCSSNNDNGDPAMLVLNSIEQTRDSVVLFNSSFQAIVENYIGITMLTEDIDYVQLDGKPITSFGTPQQVAGNPKYAFINVTVSAGSHQIFSRGCGVIAYAYGFGFAESYAYGGGASYKDIAANPIIDGGCAGAEIDFEENLDSFRYNVMWDFGDGTASSEHTFEKIYQDTGIYHVELVLEDKCLDEINEFEKDILISKRKLLDVAIPQVMCEKESVTLTASDIADASYLWSGPASFSSTQQNPMIDQLKLENGGAYNVVSSFFGCKSFPAFTEVTVLPLPYIGLPENKIFCPRDSFLTLIAGDFLSYEWNDGSTQANLIVEKQGIYWVEVAGENGCFNQDSIEVIEVCLPLVYFPSVISLNASNAQNGSFVPIVQDVFEGELSIFDRWGNLIFFTNDLNKGWNGTFEGKECATGVYVYHFSFTGFDLDSQVKKYQKVGTVTLVK